MSTAIKFSNVFKSFGQVNALKGVNLDIKKGEFFGLLGPNGAGKSTMISILAGLTRADSGSISVLGHDVIRDYRAARKDLGIVPQELVFDSFFTVREVLKIQSGYFGFGRKNDGWIDELLEELQLSDKANSNMRSLSGGMKRRVLIAQALVHKPEIVVLDEPTAGVDVELRKSLWEFVRKLHQQGHTIVLTTHYLEEAESLCDRIAILNHGDIIALDSKQALLDSDIGKMMRVIITAAESIVDLPVGLNARLLKHDGNVIELEFHKDQASIIDIINKLAQLDIEIIDLQTSRADLEDVFVDLVQGNAS